MRTLDDIDKEIIYNINKENKKNLKRMDSVIGHLLNRINPLSFYTTMFICLLLMKLKLQKC